MTQWIGLKWLKCCVMPWWALTAAHTTNGLLLTARIQGEVRTAAVWLSGVRHIN